MKTDSPRAAPTQPIAVSPTLHPQVSTHIKGLNIWWSRAQEEGGRATGPARKTDAVALRLTASVDRPPHHRAPRNRELFHLIPSHKSGPLCHVLRALVCLRACRESACDEITAVTDKNVRFTFIIHFEFMSHPDRGLHQNQSATGSNLHVGCHGLHGRTARTARTVRSRSMGQHGARTRQADQARTSTVHRPARARTKTDSTYNTDKHKTYIYARPTGRARSSRPTAPGELRAPGAGISYGS